MSLFRPLHKEKFHLGIAIGTGSVNAILYGTERKAKPKVYKSVLRPHSIMPQPDFKALEQFIKSEFAEVQRACADATQGVPIDTVQVLFSSPWYFSQTRIVTVTHDEPFIPDNAFLKKNVEEEKARFLQDARTQFSFPAEEYAIIEMSFMKILMNGYEVNTLLHKRARELTLDMHMSLSLRNFVDHVTHTVMTHFAPRDIIFHTSPGIIFSTLKQLWGHEEDKAMFDIDAGVLAVEIGGEITDITVIRKGIIEETFSFGKGLHFIVRRLASAFGIVPKDAISLFQAWIRGDVAEKQKIKIKSIVEEGLEEWKGLFHTVIVDASDRALLPRTVVFLGEGAVYDGFAKAFSDEGLKEYVLQNKPFDVIQLTPSFFRSSFEGSSGAFTGTTEAAFLYMLALPVEFNRID